MSELKAQSVSLLEQYVGTPQKSFVSTELDQATGPFPQQHLKEATMKVLSLVAASSILLGATVAASAAHYQAHYRTHHYGVYGAEAYGRYGAYGAYDAHGACGAAARYDGNGLCPLRWGERPEELTQDRDYQETIGEPC